MVSAKTFNPFNNQCRPTKIGEEKNLEKEKKRFCEVVSKVNVGTSESS